MLVIGIVSEKIILQTVINCSLFILQRIIFVDILPTCYNHSLMKHTAL